MNDNEKLNQGHGHVKPRPDGHKARCGGPGICAVCRAEKAQAATESAPAAGIFTDKERIDCLRVTNEQLRERAEAAEAALAEQRAIEENLREVVAYEQRHAAESEVALAAEKARADRAEAELANMYTQSTRDEDVSKKQPEIDMSQRAASDDDLPPLTMSVYETRTALELERQRRADVAARAVGGVDELKRYAISPKGGEMLPFSSGDYYRVSDVRALLATAPIAPVGDGDERALLEFLESEDFFQLTQWHASSASVEFQDERPQVVANSPIEALRAALTQQKGN